MAFFPKSFPRHYDMLPFQVGKPKENFFSYFKLVIQQPYDDPQIASLKGLPSTFQSMTNRMH